MSVDDANLRPFGVWERRGFLLTYAWRTRRVQILVVTVALVVLGFGAFYSESLCPPWTGPAATGASPHPEDLPSWLSNVQAVLGAFTLLVALFVWLDELRDDWEEGLPSRMSVYFFHAGRPVIACRHVWLAGADDLRAWGQQVGAQAVGERFLDFSPDLAARPPRLMVLPDGSPCLHHAVCFQLTRLPAALAGETGRCRYQNLVAADTAVRSASVELVEALPDVAAWKADARV